MNLEVHAGFILATTYLGVITSGGSGSDFFGFGLSQGTLFRVRVHRVCHLEQLSGSGFNDSGFRVERV